MNELKSSPSFINLKAQVVALRAALEQMVYAYPYDPPCRNWEPKALGHKMAKKAFKMLLTEKRN